jgi:putative transposase
MDYYQPLLAGEKYHILSRATGSENLFTAHENYHFFLKRFD